MIGGGLAGCEAAIQLARRGVDVELFEMRPAESTPAHQTNDLAELVCSNSLKTENPGSAPWLLKQELRRMGSGLLECAEKARIPGGNALTVDRRVFADAVTQAVVNEGRIRLLRERVDEIPANRVVVIASGPLTSDRLADEIGTLTGAERLFFHDAISPIVDAESIDRDVVFAASRWDNSLDGTADYLNCPFEKDQYDAFYDALMSAEQHRGHDFDNPNYFEGCLPIEEIARRGRDTLRFGPMKPVGLRDPRDGRRFYAIVQLRQEDARANSYNLVGFQNHLKYGEQKRVLRMIPGLEKAEFLRYGQIHRNTYINAPALLTAGMQMREHPRVLFGGQISGVEGYVESISTGLMAGWNAARVVAGLAPVEWPRESAHGSLGAYISGADTRDYQPANITFDLLPQLQDEERRKFRKDKKARRARQCEKGLLALDAFLKQHDLVAA